FHAKRVAMAETYRELLSDLPIDCPVPAIPGSSHAWHLFPIKIHQDAGIQRDEYILKLAVAEIGCSVHFIPLHLQPYWRDTYHLSPEMLPNAQAAFEQEVSIPLYTKMTDDDLLRVVEAIKKVLDLD